MEEDPKLDSCVGLAIILLLLGWDCITYVKMVFFFKALYCLVVAQLWCCVIRNIVEQLGLAYYLGHVEEV